MIRGVGVREAGIVVGVGEGGGGGGSGEGVASVAAAFLYCSPLAARDTLCTVGAPAVAMSSAGSWTLLHDDEREADVEQPLPPVSAADWAASPAWIGAAANPSPVHSAGGSDSALAVAAPAPAPPTGGSESAAQCALPAVRTERRAVGPLKSCCVDVVHCRSGCVSNSSG